MQLAFPSPFKPTDASSVDEKLASGYVSCKQYLPVTINLNRNAIHLLWPLL